MPTLFETLRPFGHLPYISVNFVIGEHKCYSVVWRSSFHFRGRMLIVDSA
ncbi:hypothetical protein V6Z12_D03G194500 [Gossypium hirsutum]